MTDYLTEQLAFQRVQNAVAAGTGDVISSARVDAQAFGTDDIVFAVILGDVAANAVITCKIKENTIDGTTGATDIPGALYQATASATDHDNVVILLEAKRSIITKRYVYLELTRATANIVVDGIVAVIGDVRRMSVSQHSTVKTTVRVGS